MSRRWCGTRLQGPATVSIVYEIGPFRLDPDAGILTRDGNLTVLGPRAVAVLRTLVERTNECVSKAGIIDAVWPGLVVEESNLAVQVAAIRRVLGEVPGGERWIETLAYALTQGLAMFRENKSRSWHCATAATRSRLPIMSRRSGANT